MFHAAGFKLQASGFTFHAAGFRPPQAAPDEYLGARGLPLKSLFPASRQHSHQSPAYVGPRNSLKIKAKTYISHISHLFSNKNVLVNTENSSRAVIGPSYVYIEFGAL